MASPKKSLRWLVVSFIHRTELCKSRSHARTVQIVAQEHARLLSATPMEIAQSESAVVI